MKRSFVVYNHHIAALPILLRPGRLHAVYPVCSSSAAPSLLCTASSAGFYDASCSFLLTSSKFSTRSGTSSSSSPPCPAAAFACSMTACRSGRPPSLAAKDE